MQYVALIPITSVINGKLILTLHPGIASQMYLFWTNMIKFCLFESRWLLTRVQHSYSPSKWTLSLRAPFLTYSCGCTYLLYLLLAQLLLLHVIASKALSEMSAKHAECLNIIAAAVSKFDEWRYGESTATAKLTFFLVDTFSSEYFQEIYAT